MNTVGPILPTEPASPSPFTIKISWDSSVEAAPVGFTTDILAAVRYLETEFSNPVTITIDVGYGEIDGSPLSTDDLGESGKYLQPVSYTSLRDALITNASTPTDASVVQSLPAQSPVVNANYVVATAEAKALGLPVTIQPPVDGYVGFAPSTDFTYGDTAAGGGVASGTYDFFAVAVHEFTEDMGRELLTGSIFDNIPNSYTLLDLLHYSGPGIRDFSASKPGYFSVNNGVTNLGEFNTISTGDSGDWALDEPDNPYDAFGNPGVAQPVTNDDLAEMEALGWKPNGAGFPTSPVVLSANPPAIPVSAPSSPSLVPVHDPISDLTIGLTGVSYTPSAQYLAFAQDRDGLAAGSPVAMVAEDGGTIADKYNYTLSGASAPWFSITQTPAGAALAIGSLNVTGTSSGMLYPVTVTVTDESLAAKPSANDPVNVVVGDYGQDTINLVTIPGIVTSAPSFIYGFSGSDTINGTGMTGSLYIQAGTAGATMTGGSGQNVYEFGAGEPGSTGSVRDIITNFNAAIDVIDLTWVGWRFSGVGPLAASATTIAADQAGWQTSGGNTFVYVNTSGGPEALSAADMKIELRGAIALTVANFAHG